MKLFARCNIVICVIITLLILTSLFCGCGYNKIMRDHFSNPDNYYEIEIEVIRIYTFDSDGNVDKYEDRFVDISCSADIDLNAADLFYIEGKVLNGNVPYFNDDDYAKLVEISFEISQANILHLLSTDFYDVVEVGDNVKLRSTFWTYWDRDWQYVAEISLNDVTYLNFNEGLQNIIDYVNANKSLF